MGVVICVWGGGGRDVEVFRGLDLIVRGKGLVVMDLGEGGGEVGKMCFISSGVGKGRCFGIRLRETGR